MKLKHHLLSAIAAASLAAVSGQAVALPAFADVVTIVDESGSMAGEHAWLPGMISALDTGLITAGLTGNNFGLVGFGGGASHGPNSGHQHDVGASGSEFGTATQFSTAAGGLVASGGLEDGWTAIALANSYTYRSGAARNYILVTDEDRDNEDASLTYANVLSSMTGTNTLLNAVVNSTFSCTSSAGSVLGLGQNGAGYIADGAGGYTVGSGCTALTGSSNSFGTTIGDYVNLALATGGAAWDLNLLRAGGLAATSFTSAFIAIKVKEITTQNDVPEPGTLALVSLALLGIGAARRKSA